VQKTRVGEVGIVALSDNVQGYASPQVYNQAGDAIERYRDRLTPDGKVELNFGCFLLRADGQTILVDTGWGPEHEGKLLDEMLEAGVRREEVNIVVFTHLHGDHTGWNIERLSGKALFPAARYLVPEEDWRHYSSRERPPASFERDVRPLEALGCLELFSGERSLTPSLTTLPTPGHTPGHTSIIIDSAGERGLIIGDVVISTIDVEEPEWPNTFDWDHDIARQTRLSVLERAEREQALVGASHLAAPGLGRFVRLEGRRVWQAL
jgi:glyoxylase-like metal-dependent hydrolase (beta-lactamase superfamily II)